MTVYLEDLSAGQELVSVRRTVTEADIAAFAELSGDFNPLHLDAAWVRENTPYRDCIAHGLLVVSISSGLATPGLDDLLVIGYLEVTRTFAAPAYAGDTIQAHWRVLETRRSRSRPDAGVVRLGLEVRNQDGAVLQHGTDVNLVGARPAEAPG